MREHHQLVAAERQRLQPAIGRLERQHAEVQAAVEEVRGDGAGAHTADLDKGLWMGFREAVEVGEQRVNCGFVGADNYSAAPNLL